ncbi:MAG: hypothetical protein ACKOXI_02850 [Candidatus Planktophila sp.]
MNSGSRTTSLVAAVMGAILLAPIQSPSAFAANRATATHSAISVSTGTMAVFSADTYTATNPMAALVTPVINGRAKVFYLINGGDFGIARWTITLTLPSGTSIANFRRCDLNVSFIANDICGSGTYTALTISASTATTFIITLPAGSFYALQIRQNKNTNMTVSVSASTAFISDAGLTNS